jgi:hypothetical protein
LLLIAATFVLTLQLPLMLPEGSFQIAPDQIAPVLMKGNTARGAVATTDTLGRGFGPYPKNTSFSNQQ